MNKLILKVFTLLALSLIRLNLAMAITPLDWAMNGVNNHGTWVYDTTYSSAGDRLSFEQGMFANQLQRYNNSAPSSHQINLIYVYTTDLEMYCRGSGQSSALSPCTSQELQEYYSPRFMQNKLSTASQSIAQYATINSSKAPIKLMAIVDGRVNSFPIGSPNDVLNSLNILPESEAIIFADNVAQAFCSDNRIVGVQFDIEPFSFSGKNGAYQTGINTNLPTQGQKYFFTEIAKQFNSSQFGCKNFNYPQGRIFSIFTTADNITPEVAAVLNKYHNGYVIDSLYDLGNKVGGTANSLAEYNKLVKREITKMALVANKYQLSYKFALPAAASAQEFEQFNNLTSGVNQVEYVKAALVSIRQSNAWRDPLFKGEDLWGWNSALWLIITNESGIVKSQILPADPSQDRLNKVMPYLKNNL